MRKAWLAACALLIALIFLLVAWELFLAPVKPGGSWLVLKVLGPTIIYVALIGYLGLYVSSALFITFFMCWLGKYSLFKALPVAIVIPVILFWMFEVAFLIPLPKGPLEHALGF